MKRLEVTLENPNGILIDLTAEEITQKKTDEAKMAELQADYDALQYQRNRAEEYPSIKDQLDKIYHSGIDEWKKVIKATKDKYPKWVY